MAREHITMYLRDLVQEAYGDDYIRILRALSELENGFCGCELGFSTFPLLLKAKGITPDRSYTREYGVPMEDGEQAATPEQRAKIREALGNAGFPI